MIGRLAIWLLPFTPRSIVRKVASRYVAGEDLASASLVVQSLNARSYLATMDILGENAADSNVADGTVREYLDVLDRIRTDSLQSNVSLKLSHLGVRLSREAARERLASIVQHARKLDNFVWIDMEDSSLTDETLDVYRLFWARGEPVGAVLQSYLRRTLDDARSLASIGARVRLCKGIYREPSSIAFRGREEIRESFLAAADALFASPDTMVAFATHDRLLIERCLRLVAKRGVPPTRFEFQVLLGVPIEDVLDPLVSQGIAARVYVPFGPEWYPYASRRLRENPRIASYILRQMFLPSGRRRG